MIRSKRPRNYDASGRQRRAAENQERAFEAARRLFAERGYAETTMAAIASEAGIAVPTLYAAFQSKRGVLSRLLDRLVTGERGGRSILHTPGARAVLAEPDGRRALTRFAEHMTKIQDRVGPIFEVMKNAARSEPDVAEMLARAQRNRFANLRAVALHLADIGALREGLSVDDAARTIWVLASGETRQMLAVHAGWAASKYEAWLADTLVAALLR